VSGDAIDGVVVAVVDVPVDVTVVATGVVTGAVTGDTKGAVTGVTLGVTLAGAGAELLASFSAGWPVALARKAPTVDWWAVAWS
jgi:hypothetical protein